jgi:hypothetical protein
MEYSGIVKSERINGKAQIIVEPDGLLLVTPFDTFPIPYMDIEKFSLQDHTAHIETVTGSCEISGLGLAGEPFLDAVCAAYNDKVRKALFVEGAPLLKTKGEFQCREGGWTETGRGTLEVYGDCVLLLPPNAGARRVPLCFVTAMDATSYALTLHLDGGDSYTFTKMGYDAAPFADMVERQLKAIRQRALERVKALDPTLTSIQAADIAKRMPEGIAAMVGDLTQIAPSFVRALEEKIGESRAAHSYAVFKTICEPERICVGMIENEPAGDAAEGQEDAGEGMMLWMIAPGKDGRTAAVEFAVAEGEAAATFLYRYTEDFGPFVRAFNRAFEAIGFKREAVWIRDTDLAKRENGYYLMAVRRNEMLRQIRGCFAGRVIHASPESWEKALREAMKP